MGSKERRQREAEETRGRILDAARELFVLRGYDATTMRAIARRIEYTPTAIYHHFRNKEALFQELCRRDLRSLSIAFQRMGRIEDPVLRIQRSGRAYVQFAAEHPMHYQLVFMTPAPLPENGTEGDFDPLDPSMDAYAFLQDAVREAMDQGRFRPELQDPDEVAHLLWSGLHGLVSLAIAMGGHPAVKESELMDRAAAMRNVLMRGLLADPSALEEER